MNILIGLILGETSVVLFLLGMVLVKYLMRK
jgi:hypothetical protein